MDGAREAPFFLPCYDWYALRLADQSSPVMCSPDQRAILLVGI